jgi:hypothetical protein
MSCIGGTDFEYVYANLIQPNCATNNNVGSIDVVIVDGNGSYRYIWFKNGLPIASGPIDISNPVTFDLIPANNYRVVVINPATGCGGAGTEDEVAPDSGCPVPTDEEFPHPCIEGTGYEIFPSSFVPPTCDIPLGGITYNNDTTSSEDFLYVWTRDNEVIDIGRIDIDQSERFGLEPGFTYQIHAAGLVSDCLSASVPGTIPTLINCCEVEYLDQELLFVCGSSFIFRRTYDISCCEDLTIGYRYSNDFGDSTIYTSTSSNGILTLEGSGQYPAVGTYNHFFDIVSINNPSGCTLPFVENDVFSETYTLLQQELDDCNPCQDTITITGNTELCSDDFLSLVSTFIPGATYSWTGPNGVTSTTSALAVLNPQSGTYTVTVVDGECVYSDSVDVTVSDIQIQLSSNTLDCTGDDSIVSAVTSGGIGVTTNEWKINGTVDTETSNILTTQLPVGINVIELTVTDSIGCSNTEQITIEIDPVVSNIQDLNTITIGCLTDLGVSYLTSAQGDSFSFNKCCKFISADPATLTLTYADNTVYTETFQPIIGAFTPGLQRIQFAGVDIGNANNISINCATQSPVQYQYTVVVNTENCGTITRTYSGFVQLNCCPECVGALDGDPCSYGICCDGDCIPTPNITIT